MYVFFIVLFLMQSQDSGFILAIHSQTQYTNQHLQIPTILTLLGALNNLSSLLQTHISILGDMLVSQTMVKS